MKVASIFLARELLADALRATVGTPQGFAETLVLEGIAASIGSIGDAYDNALAETTIGLFKTEAVGRGSPTTSHPMNTKPPTTLKPRHAARDASTMKPASNPDGSSRSAR